MAIEQKDDACPGCGQAVACGIAAGRSTCWCMALPSPLPLPQAGGDARCYCAACLERLSSGAKDAREARE